MAFAASFLLEITESQRRLAGDLGTERLGKSVAEAISRLMEIPNLLIIGVDRDSLGPWAEKTGNWKVRSYSLEAVRKALRSDSSYFIGGVLNSDPSLSQI